MYGPQDATAAGPPVIQRPLGYPAPVNNPAQPYHHPSVPYSQGGYVPPQQYAYGGAGYAPPGPSYPAAHAYAPAPPLHQYAAPPPQPPPQQHNPSAYATPSPTTPSSAGPSFNYPSPSVYTPPVVSANAIPAPTPKAAYQAPVFKTFQERKREKEAALRAAAAGASSTSSPSMSASTSPVVSPTTSSMNLGAHARTSSNSSMTGQQQFAPPPAALAMMGSAGSARPLPPPRVANGADPASHSRQSSWSQGAPTPPTSAGVQRPPAPESSRPLPPPRAPSQNHNNPQSSGARVSGLPNWPTSSAVTPGAPGTGPLPGVPRNAAVQALLDRSDTVSSVKSLDRADGYSSPGKRMLPRPPVNINSSKSLDRGAPTPDAVAGLRKQIGRRGPSPVAEEGPAELAARMARVSVGDVVPHNPRSPTSSNASMSPNTSPETVLRGLPRIGRPVSPQPPPRSASPNRAPSPQPPARGPSPQPPVLPMSPKRAEPFQPSARATSPKPPVSRRAKPPPSPPTRLPFIAPVINVDEPGSKRNSAPSISINVPSVPVISVGGSPTTPTIAITPPGPTISVGSDQGSRPSSPGFGFSETPTIAVSTSDTRDTGSVPAINVPNSRIRTGPSAAAPTRIQTQSAIICAGCNNVIIGRIVNAMQQRWHPQCFQCGVCGELLEHVSAYEHEGKAFCHLDYHDRFAHKCHHCQTPIVDPRFITLDVPEIGAQRYYHELHFFCSECGDPFLDPSQSSAPGTEFLPRTSTEEEEEAAETGAFVVHKGHPYCERCDLRLHKPKCKQCKKPIPGPALTALGAQWHQECFVCVKCSQPFGNGFFFPTSDGAALCTECYEA